MKSLLNKFRKTPVEPALPPQEDKDFDLVNPFTTPADSTDTECVLPADFVTDDAKGDPELLAAERKDGRFKTILDSLPKPSLGGGYALLAFQAGSFGLRGAIIRNTKHNAILAGVAESRNVDFTRAIAEVLEQLKAQHKGLPKQAILVTPSVISSIVELPVSPLRPKSDEEMQELIRWELEGTLTQQNKHWLIGSMLVERGYLTPSQRDELVEELKIRQSQGGQDGLVRFGDLAVKLNYISQEQLEECFVLQGKLIAVDDDLAYGWQAEEPQLTQGLSDEVLLSADEDGDSSHKWLVSGMSKAVRRRWVGAFNLNGIKLQAFYPAVGSSYAMLGQRCSDSEQALIEIHQEQLAFINGGPNAVSEIRVEERLHGEIRYDEIQNLIGILPADLHKIYINFQGKEVEELLFTLSSYTSVELEILNLDGLELPKPEHLEINALIGLLGAADHFLQHIPKARLSWIPARDAEVALWKKILTPKFMLTSAAILIVASMLGFVGWMHWNMWQQDLRFTELSARFDKEKKLKSQFESIASEQILLKQKIEDARNEVKLNAELLSNLSGQVVTEKEISSLLLKVLAIVTPDTVSIVSYRHHNRNIEIDALAYSNTDGQFFINSLNKAMKPMAYEVVRSDVARSPDSLDLYAISIQLGRDFEQKVTKK